MKKSNVFVGLVFITPLAIAIYLGATWHISFSREVEGRLKRAADASTLPIAKTEVDAALSYLEANNMKSGYTSVIYRTPDEDMGYWYGNLKALSGEMDKAMKDPKVGQLEATNILMKCRETIMDGNTITVPPGAANFPANIAFTIYCVVSVFFAFIGAMFFIAAANDF